MYGDIGNIPTPNDEIVHQAQAQIRYHREILADPSRHAMHDISRRQIEFYQATIDRCQS